MTISKLGADLNALTVNGQALRFARYGWSSAPTGDYGVYAEDGEDVFYDDNRHGERLTEGTIDWFTRSIDSGAKEAIEEYLDELRSSETFAWYLNSVEYENATRYLHFEWVFRLG